MQKEENKQNKKNRSSFKASGPKQRPILHKKSSMLDQLLFEEANCLALDEFTKEAQE